METIASQTFQAMMQYLRGGGMNAIIPKGIQEELPKILNKNLYGDGLVKPKATHSSWLSEDTALKALHNCGFWEDHTTNAWREPRIPEPGENDAINNVIMEMRRAKTRKQPPRALSQAAADSWWRAKEAHSVGGIEEWQWKQFAQRDLQLDRAAGIETLIALNDEELQEAIIEGRRRYVEREKHS
jgi:hypothetical protein